jgi:release factor glutamine methyltransferase
MNTIKHTLVLFSEKINLFEAEILLAFVLRKSRTYLYTFPEIELTIEQAEQFYQLVDRRVAGEPIAYLINEKEFWSLSLKVTPAVLIPRPETELLVELILKEFGNQAELSILDLGTGSGAIALALASEKPHCKILAIDKSEAALDVARENAQCLKITNIDFQQSSWFENINAQFDVIVSNPPYITEDDNHLKTGDLRFEPQTALMALENGLSDFKTIISEAKNYLKPRGALFFEHGYDQAESVSNLLREYHFTGIQTFQDLAGLDRVTRGYNHNI